MSRITRGETDWLAFADEWVYGTGSQEGYLAHYHERFGAEALASITVDAGPVPVAGVRYGYARELVFRREARS
jgi:hypothetical protein